MNLFQAGDFISHAGLALKWKIECDALQSEEWDCIALMIKGYLDRPFRYAEGIPRGGIALANALNKYRTDNRHHQILVCDDVWTTGTSFKEYRNEHHPGTLRAELIKWVVFARRPTNDGVKALFTMPSE